MDKKHIQIAVIGLGYVGLGLAVALSQKQKVIGFDKDKSRINELKQNHDRNYDLNAEVLSKADIKYTYRASDLAAANFYIISVPTPVNETKIPDISLLLEASSIVGKHLKKGDIVVYESTVYPGATEEDCIPVLEQASKLICGVDFKVGYSPERVDPGNALHTLENTKKIISAQDEDTLETLASVYGDIIKAGLYRAPTIRIAEAAKVIENTQRDLNISLINEIALIMHQLGVDTTEVLKAAATKWNFLHFQPGLVGGHCIGVDPYYLTHKAMSVGYYPDVILAGRRVNDSMGQFIAERTIKKLIDLGTPVKHSKIAVLGLAFKENCADIRNSRVFDLIKELETYHAQVLVHDPMVNHQIVREQSGVTLVSWEEIKDIDAMILAVAHEKFKKLDAEEFKKRLNYRGLIMDVKSILDPKLFEHSGISLWRL